MLKRRLPSGCLLLLLASGWAHPIPAPAQGPMPEEGATLFPHGALLSLGSTFTQRESAPANGASPSPQHPALEGVLPITFSWSFRRDLQVSATLPLIYKDDSGAQPSSVAGIGDALITFKHRFVRLDSERGTTQASFTIGPKFATGGKDRRNLNGEFLAVEMQPGTGTTDLFAKINLTYTGLFHLRRLVADPSFSYLRRFGSLRGTSMGDEAEARLWIHYRPLQSQLVGGEWFIGPTFTWQHSAANRSSRERLPGTGSSVFSVGVTSYVSPRGGLVFWAGVDFPVAQDWNGSPTEQKRRFHLGITKQFVLQP